MHVLCRFRQQNKSFFDFSFFGQILIFSKKCFLQWPVETLSSTIPISFIIRKIWDSVAHSGKWPSNCLFTFSTKQQRKITALVTSIGLRLLVFGSQTSRLIECLYKVFLPLLDTKHNELHARAMTSVTIQYWFAADERFLVPLCPYVTNLVWPLKFSTKTFLSLDVT